MSSLFDFDDQAHRMFAAAAAFQKGVYQLFVLRSHQQTDWYDRLLRSYQCLFQLGVTLVLLDETFSLNASLKKIPGPLRTKCDPKNPKRNELDPACLVTHSVFEKHKWQGFQVSHPLAAIGRETIDLYSRVVDARHNLLYRPFLLDGPHWEDCTLITLIGKSPPRLEIEPHTSTLSRRFGNGEIAIEARGLRRTSSLRFSLLTRIGAPNDPAKLCSFHTPGCYATVTKPFFTGCATFVTHLSASMNMRSARVLVSLHHGGWVKSERGT